MGIRGRGPAVLIVSEVGDLVLTPRGAVDTGALSGSSERVLEPAAIDVHGRQPGDERRLGRRRSVPGPLDPSIAIVLQSAAASRGRSGRLADR